MEELMEIEEDHIVEGFNQVVEKYIPRVWNDCNIRQKILQLGSLFLLYDNKYSPHDPSKLCMLSLGPFRLVYITEESDAKLETIQVKPLKGLINGNKLKVYYIPQGSTTI
jgi:hypothetical protein